MSVDDSKTGHSELSAPVVDRIGRTAIAVRLFGWLTLFLLTAFLTNNALQVCLDFPELSGLPQTWIEALQAFFYVIAAMLAVIYVFWQPNNALRWEARQIGAFNAWMVRAAFFIVLLVGIVDATIAFVRVEELAVGFEDLARNLRQPVWIGMYVHVPLVFVGILIACFSRMLGFPWLALMIVASELLIVITRFIFSYEQAFMGDLVRYWYAALFLFASAHTLVEEGHVRVDVFYAGFGRTKQGFCNAIGTILFGMVTAWVIIIIGFDGKQSIINSPIANFEISQSGMAGMFTKYQMAAFIGFFSITMLIQFVSYFFEAVADMRNEPGHIEHTGPAH
jgi:TRAP-type mannitol/chloroaromatic compound transport system permease small subunit